MHCWLVVLVVDAGESVDMDVEAGLFACELVATGLDEEPHGS